MRTRFLNLSMVVGVAFGLYVTLSAMDAVQAEGWASLSGRFVYDGKAPEPVKCNVTKDVEVCTKHHPVEEDLVVDAQGGLANVLVWVRDGITETHPDYAEAAKQPVISDNLNCRFTPHIVAVRTGQTFRVSNSDAAGHNSLGLCRSNPQFNINLPPGGHRDLVFTSAERLPFKISCAIHPWMNSYVLIQEHPYMATSAKDGSFRIANLPAGVPLEFQVWHESAGYVSEVTKDSKPTEWTRGRFTKTFEAGDHDLGEIRVDPSLFSN